MRGRWTYQKIDPLVSDLDMNLEHLGITHFQLVDLALMLKTDYFDGIHGIGPKTALKFIKQYGTIENIMNGEGVNFDFSDLSPELIKTFRKLFLLPDVLESFDNMYWDPPNKQRVLELLCRDHHLDSERVGDNTDRLSENFYETLHTFQYQRRHSKSVQKTLDMVLH